MIVFLQMIDTLEDKNKFMQVYETYNGLMYHVAYQILNNKEDAEDAVQNAFFKIAKNIEKISEPICPKTKSFVVIIVKRKAIDIANAKKLHPTEELTDTMTDGSFEDNLPDDRLARCILSLPEKYREVILLKYRHGYNIMEISQILGISFFAAAKLNQRAKKKLKNLCEKEGLL